jgi:hypothetical protein
MVRFLTHPSLATAVTRSSIPPRKPDPSLGAMERCSAMTGRCIGWYSAALPRSLKGFERATAATAARKNSPSSSLQRTLTVASRRPPSSAALSRCTPAARCLPGFAGAWCELGDAVVSACMSRVTARLPINLCSSKDRRLAAGRQGSTQALRRSRLALLPWRRSPVNPFGRRGQHQLGHVRILE